MSSNPRQIENFKPLRQAGDCFVSAVMEVQVLYLGLFDCGAENAVPAVIVNVEGVGAAVGISIPDGLENFKGARGHGNVTAVIVFCFGQMHNATANVSVGCSENFTRPHGRLNRKQKYRARDLFFSHPRQRLQIERLNQFVNFILINAPRSSLASRGASNIRHRVNAQEAPFFCRRDKDVFKQIHLARHAGRFDLSQAHITPRGKIYRGYIANDVFTEGLSPNGIGGKPVEPDHFPTLALFASGPLQCVAIKDLAHGVAAVGSAGDANFKFTRPNLSLALGPKGLGFADGLTIYAARYLRLPSELGFYKCSHAANSNRVVATLATDVSRTSHGLPKPAQKEDKGKTMNEHVPNFGGNGAPRRTRTADPLLTKQLLYQLSYWGYAPRPLNARGESCKAEKDFPAPRDAFVGTTVVNRMFATNR